MIRLTLPVPPALNNLYPTSRGKRFLSTEGRRFKEAVRLVCLVERVQPLAGKLSVSMHWFRARRAGDLDGRAKAVLDSLKGFAFADDGQVFRLAMSMSDAEPKRARMEVTIEPFVSSEPIP